MKNGEERTSFAAALARLGATLGVDDPGLLSALESAITPQLLPSGGVLFREGDPSDAMYVVLRGELQASILNPQHGELIIGCVGPGEPVGEMQILSQGTRTATVRATTDTELARVPRLAVERLARDAPDALQQLAEAIRRRLRRNQLAAILPALFGVLDETMLREIEASVTWEALPRGATLFEQGQAGDRAYILVSGRLQASVRDTAGGENVAGEIVRGEMVGEMAVFTGEPRSALVRALRDSELVSLDRAAFERLIAKYPQMLLALTRLVIHRLREAQSGRRQDSPVRTIAVIAAGPDVPLADFARRLTVALSEFGATTHVSAADLDRHLGTPGLARTPPDDPSAARIPSWLDEQEMHHRFVVLETDMTASPWSMRCVRQADRILVVGRAGDDPAPGAAERVLTGAGEAPCLVPASLVLLHPPDTRLPSGTRQWLEGRHLLRHNHIRAGDPEDVARLARFIAGRAIGVALGGGGARGFAHIGVLDAFKEAGISVDMIGGTSMGAVVAAEYALGWDADTMARQNEIIFGGWGRDLTLPLLSFLGGRKSKARLAACIGDVQIEDLWIPYFCVSSNLSRARLEIHRTGLLRRGIRASASLPGVLPPVVSDGDLLVDGALLRNLPADIVRDLGGDGTIVAVDVSADSDLHYGHPYDDAISGWRIAWNRLSPFAPKVVVPSIAAVLQRSAELASVAMQRDALLRGIDLYVRVPLTAFGLLDFDRAPEIIAAGRRAARQALARWPAWKAAGPH